MIIGDIETTEKVEYEDLLKNYYEKMEIIEEQDKEIERLNNIIKEVRKYIENYPTLRYSSMDNSNGNRLTGKLVPTDKILEILDKENKE